MYKIKEELKQPSRTKIIQCNTTWSSMEVASRSKSFPESTDQFLKVVSSDVFTVRAPALRTPLKMKFRTELAWKSILP